MTPSPSASSSSPEKSPKNSARRYVILGLVVVLVLVGWSAFWVFSRNKTQALVDKVLNRQVGGQALVTCEDQSLGGYPFRLLLTCSSYKAHDPKSGWQISGGPLRAIWQVYSPNLALLEGDNMLKLNHPPTGLETTIKASLIRASIRLEPNLALSRLSIEAQDMELASNLRPLGQQVPPVTAKNLEVHARPNPQNADDLDLALTAVELDTSLIPRLDGSLTATALKGLSPAILQSRQPQKVWLDQSGKLEALSGVVVIGQKTLKVNGGLAFNPQGYASGKLALKILNPKPDAAKGKATLSASADGLNGPLTALQLLGKPTTDGDLVGSEVPITIQDGQLRAGLLPLGRIPPLQ